MNEKNLEALKKDLKYLGFGEGLQDQMTHHIQQQKPEFALNHQAVYNDKTLSSILHFRAGKENEMYFFNSHLNLYHSVKQLCTTGAATKHAA